MGSGHPAQPEHVVCRREVPGRFALQIPASDLYHELLPVRLVKIHGRRGVKIRGLWYDGPALDPYRSDPVTPGAAKGK